MQKILLVKIVKNIFCLKINLHNQSCFFLLLRVRLNQKNFALASKSLKFYPSKKRKLIGSFVKLWEVSSKHQSTPPSRNSSKTPTSPVPSALKMKEYVRHKVDYLGALPISASRSTNLAALQRPLKDLYFKWRALRNLGHSNLPGTLEINDNGLTVQYIRELHKGVQVRNRAHH